MGDGIAQFASLVNGTRSLRRDMAGDASGKRELLEKLFHPFGVLRDAGVKLAVAALEIGIRHQTRTAVTGAGNVDHVQVMFLDQAVEMNVDEIQARCRTPMPEQPRFDVLGFEWLPEQRIVVEIDLPDRQVVGRPPVGVHSAQLFRRERSVNRSSRTRNVLFGYGAHGD